MPDYCLDSFFFTSPVGTVCQHSGLQPRMTKTHRRLHLALASKGKNWSRNTSYLLDFSSWFQLLPVLQKVPVFFIHTLEIKSHPSLQQPYKAAIFHGTQIPKHTRICWMKIPKSINKVLSVSGWEASFESYRDMRHWYVLLDSKKKKKGSWLSF